MNMTLEKRNEKQKDVGMNWNTIILGDVVSVLSGFAFDSKFFNENTGIPLIRIRDIIRGYSETFYKGDYDDRYIITKGDMLIGMDGEFNIAEWQGENALLNQRVCKITVSNPRLLNEKYLLYFLSIQLKLIEDKASFVTVKHLSVKDITNIQIPLPPLPIQKRIAEILDAADALRKKDQELLKKYDELAQAIFIDMFGDPVKNEKGWEEFRFDELGTLDRGVSKHRPRNAPELLGGKYPLIQTGDVANSGGLIRYYKTTYSEIGLKQSRLWKKGTLCITIAANIAKTGILDFDACFPDSIVGFNANEEITNTIYVQFWLGFVQKTLEDNAPESAQKNINLEILRGLQIPCPPINLQKEFKSIVNNITQLKDRAETKSNQNLFNSILEMAFSGELVS
jgi:type I restriction enzyme S subunit